MAGRDLKGVADVLADENNWAELEDKVRRAAEEIAELRKQKRKLASRVKRLQREAADSTPSEAAWAGEKRALRERVESLIDTLESVL